MTARTTARAADALVAALPPVTLIVGKGGVGKTTAACALALRSARIADTLLLTTDPARALPLVLGEPVAAEPGPVAGAPRLRAQVLDASALRSRFLARWGDALRLVLDRGTYLDAADIAPLIETALPGTDEIFSALALAEIVGDPRGARVIVDTAPTGHTIRMLQLPGTFRAMVRLLDAMQAKHRFMVRALTRAYRNDAVDAMLAEMTSLVERLEGTLADAARCGAVLVLNDQPLVTAESRRYAAELHRLGVHVCATIWNASSVGDDPVAGGAAAYRVPRLPAWPVGPTGLERWAEALEKARRAPTHASKGDAAVRPHRARPGARPRPADDVESLLDPMLRPLTIVAGKGGVGKSTVASALAIAAAGRHRTLLVSTDPAPSLADAFAQPIGDTDTSVAGVAGLQARQMDATAAFERLRAEYSGRVDALFDGLVVRGVDFTHDHAIARDLLALAPPGIDEVYALSLLSDALFTDRYERVVVDPAPTGHLLRLLEMPALALDWSHQLLRLMLKYKDVAGLGDTAREVLNFAKSLRALDTLLRGERASVVVVALDEPVVRAETERLASDVRRLGLRITAAVVNRSSGARDPLPVPDAPVHLVAPAVAPAPIGADALRAWLDTWSVAERDGTQS